MRVPAAVGEYRRAELRSPDPMANPYLAFALMIEAGLYGIRQNLPLPQPADLNLYQADAKTLAAFRRLPENLAVARKTAAESMFIRQCLPEGIRSSYCGM